MRIDLIKLAPKGYQAVAGLDQYVRTTLAPDRLEMIKLRASMLNGCAYCVDMHSRNALEAAESTRKLFAVAAWREAPFFDAKERAALALTDWVTKLGEHGVPDDVWDEAIKEWDEKGVADLVVAISLVNLWNRLAVSTRIDLPTHV